jgi:hypothetical protein
MEIDKINKLEQFLVEFNEAKNETDRRIVMHKLTVFVGSNQDVSDAVYGINNVFKDGKNGFINKNFAENLKILISELKKRYLRDEQ